MEKIDTLIEQIQTNSKNYMLQQSKSVKLEIYERITNLLSKGIIAACVILFTVFSLMFVSFGVAYWLGERLDSPFEGFFIVGAFYFVVLGLYILLRKYIARNKVKNAILLNLSKDRDDFDLLLKDQDIVHQEIEDTMEMLKQNIKDIKQTVTGGGGSTPSPVARTIVTSTIAFIIQKMILRKAGAIPRAIVPAITNALVTSTLFKESKGKSLFENLKSSVRGFLKK